MNKLYIGIFVVVLAVVAASAGAFFFFMAPPAVNEVACTMEAKVCPDGSAVGRSGPNCSFANCPEVKAPEVKAMGTIQGKVDVGPICPVERVDVPCPVPPEAYTSREIILYASNGSTIVKRMHFLPNGTYRFEIPAGTYILNTPKQGIGGSGELPKTITVASGQTITFDFSIDTGIR